MACKVGISNLKFYNTGPHSDDAGCHLRCFPGDFPVSGRKKVDEKLSEKQEATFQRMHAR
jgi:hypothetical protein